MSFDFILHCSGFAPLFFLLPPTTLALTTLPRSTSLQDQEVQMTSLDEDLVFRLFRDLLLKPAESSRVAPGWDPGRGNLEDRGSVKLGFSQWLLQDLLNFWRQSNSKR